MTRIYLIRHAEAEGNLYRVAQGQYNSLLTDRGWRQVRALEQRFADIPVDAVYSSDLYRTCATASAIYKPKGLPVHRRKDLREICVGVWEQRTWGDIYRETPKEMENFRFHLTDWHIDGAETPEQVRDRMLSALREIAEVNKGRTVAVFSHGYAIRVTLATLQGVALEDVGQTPHGDNTAVSLLEVENSEMQVVFRDDNSHIKTPEFLAYDNGRKRATSLESGLWFRPLRLPEQEELLSSHVWTDRSLSGADFTTEETTLVGHVGEEPVGLVRFDVGTGEITLLCMRQDWRRKGYGIQLVGQAVQHVRGNGGGKLTLRQPMDEDARRFCMYYGFAPVGHTAEGVEIFEKDIRFDPEFLGE